jgi:hypothetical protein
MLMEVFTVDCEKNTFPINSRFGHQADCLNVKANDAFSNKIVLFRTLPIVLICTAHNVSESGPAYVFR